MAGRALEAMSVDAPGRYQYSVVFRGSMLTKSINISEEEMWGSGLSEMNVLMLAAANQKNRRSVRSSYNSNRGKMAILLYLAATLKRKEAGAYVMWGGNQGRQKCRREESACK